MQKLNSYSHTSKYKNEGKFSVSGITFTRCLTKSMGPMGDDLLSQFQSSLSQEVLLLKLSASNTAQERLVSERHSVDKTNLLGHQ